MKDQQRPYKVYAIEEGVVIDHIPAKKALDVINVLNAMEGGSIVTLGMNLDSKKLVKKDVVKIENKRLSRDDLMKISLIAPDASVNIIKGGSVEEKLKIEIPALFEGIIKCSNPNCITRHEPVTSKFHTVSERPFRLKCHFCERVFGREDVGLI